MAIDPQLLSILVCPENKAPLHEADATTVAELNAQITNGKIRNVGDSAVEMPLAGGLVRKGNDILYPIKDGIPVLLIDEGIRLA